jgi:hypothetical protein
MEDVRPEDGIAVANLLRALSYEKSAENSHLGTSECKPQPRGIGATEEPGVYAASSAASVSLSAITEGF